MLSILQMSVDITGLSCRDQSMSFWDNVTLQPFCRRGKWGRSRATGYWMSWVPVTYFLHECHCTWPVTDLTLDLNWNHSSMAALGSFSWNHRPSSAVDFYRSLGVSVCVCVCVCEREILSNSSLSLRQEEYTQYSQCPTFRQYLGLLAQDDFPQTCPDCNNNFIQNFLPRDNKKIMTLFFVHYIITLRNKVSTSGEKFYIRFSDRRLVKQFKCQCE